MAHVGCRPYNAAMVRTWQDALDYLYGLANWETRPPGTSLTFELDRMRSVLGRLGDPQREWPAVHVAGTNGKGSTCAMLSAAFDAGGRRVGLFTSPHLHTVRERVSVNDRLISETAVIGWLNENRAVLEEDDGLTTFEALTALAFSHFADQKVDVAVVEVGLGGRLDTTNVVDSAVTVLTTVGLDHTGVLGETREAIAHDKVGVFRPAVPIVCCPQEPEVLAIVQREASRLGCPLLTVGDDVVISEEVVTDRGQSFVVDVGGSGSGQRYVVELALMGHHQRTNAAAAVAALHALRDSEIGLSVRSIETGLANAEWPGRFERLSDGPALIVDGAHNPDAASALRRTLDERFPGLKRHLVVGVSRDKDVAGILKPLVDGAASVTATRSEHPRALPAAAVAEQLRGLGVTAHVAELPADALDWALVQAGPDQVVIATGSIFVVADVREAWADRGGMPMPPRDPPPERAAQPG